ncbi:MAG: efflux RND transporter periplasmic adaptor subunit, partial [Acidobacteriota bacterium]
QMSIDADLNAGIIDEIEARSRRREISREADFYGAMDGAAKFVRGDAVLGLVTAGGCGGPSETSAGSPQSARHGRGGGPGGPGGDAPAAVPVEVAPALRRSISSFLQTNGTLEAENEVDIVARTSGPVVELAVEEGMRVKKGELLARLDETELRAQVEIAKVAVEEARRSHARAKAARESDIISQEVYDQAVSELESAEAQLMGSRILLGYTTIVAPFDAVVIERSVKFAENVVPNQKLFRISDFDPLLCPIQVPEKELSRLKLGQSAYLSVEAWGEERFEARVLRISPVVDAATGTIKVTLEVSGRGKLRPGMFASVFLVTDTYPDALVIPKSALSLESLGDTVYVAKGNLAERRNLTLGFEEAEFVQVVEGLDAGEEVIVVGQDGLSDGTPIQVLGRPASTAPLAAGERKAARRSPGEGGRLVEGEPAKGRAGGVDPAPMSPEQMERLRQRMRDRGMTDEQIEDLIRKRRQGGTERPRW